MVHAVIFDFKPYTYIPLQARVSRREWMRLKMQLEKSIQETRGTRAMKKSLAPGQGLRQVRSLACYLFTVVVTLSCQHEVSVLSVYCCRDVVLPA